MESITSVSLRSSAQPILASLDRLVDPGTLWAIPSSLRAIDPLDYGDGSKYKSNLASSIDVSDFDESVCTFTGSIGGHKTVLICFDYSFMGGSLGVVSGERIFRALELAANLSLPVVSWIRSGGARMQEGPLGFMQMARIVAGLEQHRRSGQISIAYLDDPTTGGVFASFASLADKVIAKPGAMIGFGGPRVAMASIGRNLDPSCQRSDTLQICGVIDELCEPDNLRSRLIEVLDEENTRTTLMLDDFSSSVDSANRVSLASDLKSLSGGNETRYSSSWEAVKLSRQEGRVGLDQLAKLFDRTAKSLLGEQSGSIGAYRLNLGGYDVAMLGFRSDPSLRVTPVELGVLRRTAKALSRSVSAIIFVIDTYGAELSESAEKRGIAREIGRNILSMFSLEVPTITLLAGQGSGGGAMALMAADVVLATEDSWLAPLSPEAAAAIIDRKSQNYVEIANFQKIDAYSLRDSLVVDGVIPVSMEAGSSLCVETIRDCLVSAIGVARRGNLNLRYLRLETMNNNALSLDSRCEN